MVSPESLNYVDRRPEKHELVVPFDSTYVVLPSSPVEPLCPFSTLLDHLPIISCIGSPSISKSIDISSMVTIFSNSLGRTSTLLVSSPLMSVDFVRKDGDMLHEYIHGFL